MHSIKVIVSKCAEDRIFDKRLVDTTIDNLEDAFRLGDIFRGQNKSVIVRPNYNETDDKGKFFRE